MEKNLGIPTEAKVAIYFQYKYLESRLKAAKMALKVKEYRSYRSELLEHYWKIANDLNKLKRELTETK